MTDEATTRSWTRPVLFLIFIGVGVFLFFWLDPASHLSPEGLRELVLSFGIYGPIIYILGLIIAVFLHLPAVSMTAVGGSIFGTAQGLLYGWIGVVVGACISFLFTRYFFHGVAQNGFFDRFERIKNLDEKLAKEGFKTMLLLRIIFGGAAPLNFAMGTTRIGFPQYVAASALGLIPAISVWVYFGGMLTAMEGPKDLLKREFLLPILALGSLLVLAVLLGRRVLKGSPEEEPST